MLIFYDTNSHEFFGLRYSTKYNMDKSSLFILAIIVKQYWDNGTCTLIANLIIKAVQLFCWSSFTKEGDTTNEIFLHI